MFDLAIVRDAAREAGFGLSAHDGKAVAVMLAAGYTLVFDNGTSGGDEGIYFVNGGGWHSHGDLFASHYGTDLAMVPIAMLSDLRAGNLLIEKHAFPNGTIEIRIVFGNQIGDVNYYLGTGEEITFKKLA